MVDFLLVSELYAKTSNAQLIQCAGSKENSNLSEVFLWSDNKMMCEGTSNIARMIHYCHWHIVIINMKILGILEFSRSYDRAS